MSRIRQKIHSPDQGQNNRLIDTQYIDLIQGMSNDIVKYFMRKLVATLKRDTPIDQFQLDVLKKLHNLANKLNINPDLTKILPHIIDSL